MLTTWTSASLEQFIPLVTGINSGLLLGTRISHYSTKSIECKERTQSALPTVGVLYACFPSAPARTGFYCY